jgi:hypothetical protein
MPEAEKAQSKEEKAQEAEKDARGKVCPACNRKCATKDAAAEHCPGPGKYRARTSVPTWARGLDGKWSLLDLSWEYEQKARERAVRQPHVLGRADGSRTNRAAALRAANARALLSSGGSRHGGNKTWWG